MDLSQVVCMTYNDLIGVALVSGLVSALAYDITTYFGVKLRKKVDSLSFKIYNNQTDDKNTNKS